MMREFTPENTPDILYIYCGSYGVTTNFNDLLERAQEHFGEYIDWNDLDITSEHIHTRCLTYDLYDASDYDNYIVITRK